MDEYEVFLVIKTQKSMVKMNIFCTITPNMIKVQLFSGDMFQKKKLKSEAKKGVAYQIDIGSNLCQFDIYTDK